MTAHTVEIDVGGQRAWAHDEGDPAGTFHTFDALEVGGGPPRKVHVLVPRDGGGRRFRTIVVNDGDTAFWPGGPFGHTWEMAAILSRLANAVDPVIVVAVHPIERDREYTHVDWHDGRRGYGGLPDYARWLAEGLVPFVHANYPTLDAPSTTATLGSSHGGLAAFYTATRYPERFGWAGCLSSSFFSGLDSMVTGTREGRLADTPLVKPIRELLADRRRRPKLWIDWGMRRDGGEHNSLVEMLAERRGREMVELLVAAGYHRAIVTGPDDAKAGDAELLVHSDLVGGHDELAWRYRFGLFVRAFSPR